MKSSRSSCFSASSETSNLKSISADANVTFYFINIRATFSGVAQGFLVAKLSEGIPDMRVAYKYSFIITGIVSFVLSMIYVVFETADLWPWAQTGPKKSPNKYKRRYKDRQRQKLRYSYSRILINGIEYSLPKGSLDI
ncbi:hypothetical protein RF11_05220 [Thelohanellus kitauei]|uniref:Uncharacterized protein n=1 Tax=Thelohanellus kitauei TaxID=669202 RepID=A0A0C2IB63_THEKT|nr:hypothetical protein RF11_05220 [Thelohanellus kitauei]